MRGVTALWRHPIKSHGREALTAVTLRTGEAMPWDRIWAVAHDAAKVKDGAWAPCVNFSRVSKAPGLMAITARLDEATETVTLTHPDRADLVFRPDTDPNALIGWTAPLVPQDRARPRQIVRLDGRGFTDSDFASVTLCNAASHRAVELEMGQPLSVHRWRGNIWYEGGAPWEEFEWIGRDIHIGGAILRPVERTDRCAATTTNPDTGRRDADTLAALNAFGHQDFSVRCRVIQGGTVTIDDKVKVP